MNGYEVQVVGHGNMGNESSFGGAWSRAVYRQPPRRFCIAMSKHEKQSGEVHHGMKIIPLIDADNMSISSNTAHSEYEIWRTWEDCLWLQWHLEQEYERLAREKKQRLLAGKGIKKNGIYKQHGAASSFDSLPEGPDPHSVATKFHQLIPKMTKRGTVFKASQATLDQRQNELKNFVMALYAEDMPTLIGELRDDRLVTDFFGYWRRDYDIAVKAEKAIQKARARASSDSNSTVGRSSFSLSRLTPSALSLAISTRSVSPAPSGSPSHLRVPRSAHDSRPTSLDIPDDRSLSPASPRIPGLSRRRTYSSASSSSSGSSRSSIGSLTTPASSTQEVPLIFGHNPNSPDLESLPEDKEARLLRPKEPSTPTMSRNPRHVRDSWQTTASASTFLDGLDIGLPPDHGAARSRLSVNSVATFLTTNSADAVVPMTHGRFNPESHRNRPDRPVSVSSTWTAQTDEVIDSYLTDEFPLPPFIMTPTPPDSRPETPVGASPYGNFRATLSSDRFSVCSTATAKTARTSDFSPSASTASLATFVTAETSLGPSPVPPPAAGSPLFVKVSHNDTIVLLRALRSMSFTEVRQRIFDKFVNQEGLSLSPSYALALVIPTEPTPASPRSSNRSRSGSLSSTRSRSSSLSSEPGKNHSELVQMKFLSSQRDWELATLTVGGKLHLRVLDTFAN